MSEQVHGRAGLNKHKPFCHCGGEIDYDELFDSYFCKSSGVWLETGCGEDCNYFHCNKRPDTANYTRIIK